MTSEFVVLTSMKNFGNSSGPGLLKLIRSEAQYKSLVLHIKISVVTQIRPIDPH